MLYTKINNRRYLGNKYRILPFIKQTISENCGDFETFADIFAGTGAVSSAYTDKILYTNDILYGNYLCHLTWFSDEVFDIS
ncbi:DNA adenine methylase, partial [uncultured Treponema sp.]|uniref:DNA adenine methylase n=1 Tax=uncultured Treponema sp. TaxID=162155 RepID=UPI002636545F